MRADWNSQLTVGYKYVEAVNVYVTGLFITSR